MAHGAEQRSYVVISRPLSGRYADPNKWLGRFVRIMNKPTDQYAPTIEHSLLPIIKRFFLDELSDIDATIFTESLKDKSLRIKLTDMFNLDKTSHVEKTTQLKTPHVTTFSLQQHQLMFDALMEDEIVKKQVLGLLLSPECKGRLFMIVGAKVVYDGSISVITNLSEGQKLKTIVPAAEIATAVAANPVPTLSSQNSEVENSKDETRKSDASHSFTGARIFAFEYKKITLTRSLILRQPKDPYFSPDGPGFDCSHQVFSGGKNKDPARRVLQLDKSTASRVPGASADGGDQPIEASGDFKSEEDRAELTDSSIKLADVGDLGIGWQTESFADSGPGTLIYEASDSESDLDVGEEGD